MYVLHVVSEYNNYKGCHFLIVGGKESDEVVRNCVVVAFRASNLSYNYTR